MELTQLDIKFKELREKQISNERNKDIEKLNAMKEKYKEDFKLATSMLLFSHRLYFQYIDNGENDTQMALHLMTMEIIRSKLACYNDKRIIDYCNSVLRQF